MKHLEDKTMSNKKQSSVEWFAEKLKSQGLLIGEPDNLVAFEQAKEMHRQEIIDSFGVGCQVEASRLIGYHKMAEQYYNEIYGKDNADNTAV